MFLPENIDLAHSEKYNLSIRVAPNGFSFCIYCPNDASVFYFRETSLSNKLSQVDNVKKMIFDFGFFSQPFKETVVTIVSPDYTLVPDTFFDKKQIKELFDFNFHKITNIVFSTKSEIGDYHTVFNIDETLHSFLSRHLWNPKFQHQITPLLKLFEDYGSNKKKNRCFVDFGDKNISIICFSAQNKLLSASTFPITNAHDVSYFVANVWENRRFDQTKDMLYFSGNIEWYESDILKKLIKNVEIVELKSKVLLDEEQKKTIPTDVLALLVVV
jgi:hypothetical protein